MKALFKSFGYAGNGILYCLKNGRNMRIHLVFAAYLFYFSRFFILTAGEKAILCIAAGFVIFAEIVNTALEKLTDLVSPNYHPLAKVAKDTAAGAVLVCAMVSVIVGLLLLWQPTAFTAIWNYFTGGLWRIALLVFSLALAILFIFHKTKSHKKEQ